MLNPNAIQPGSITQDMIDAPVIDAKQNATDESLATTSKEVVGAINELFNGGVKDKSIEVGKLAQGVQDTLEIVVTNQNDIADLQGLINTKLKIINGDTDLNTIIEEGMYILTTGHTYNNFPVSDGISEAYSTMYLNVPALLIVSPFRQGENKIQQVIITTSYARYLPLIRRRLQSSQSSTSWTSWSDDSIGQLYINAGNIGPYTDNNKNLLSSMLPNGFWYIENLQGFTNKPNVFDINGPVILIATNNRIALFGCENGSYGFSQYAWRERQTSYWLSGNLKYEDVFVKNTNSLSDTEVNNIWDNN